MSRKGKRQRESWAAAPAEPFVSIFRSTLQEPAWKDLSFGARALFVLLRSFYNGQNNGRIYLAARKAADDLNASKNSVTKWFRELEDHGFIRPVQGAFLGSDGLAQAAYWRLTEVGYMGEPPSREYRQWPAENKTPSQKMRDPSHFLGGGVPENGTATRDQSQKVGRFDPEMPHSASQKVGQSTVPYAVPISGGRAHAI